jgi:hypothetical protein
MDLGVSEFSKDLNTFIFKGEAEVECLKLEDEGIAVVRNVETARPETRCHIPEQQTLQQYRCEKLSSRSFH